MSYLPIAKRDIVTPFNIAAGESASLVVTANNKASLVRQGGFHYSLTMGIRPYNLLVDSQNYTYWDVVTFLNTEPYFYVPIFNMRETEIFAAAPTITTVGTHAPGVQTITIAGYGANSFRPGEFIKLGNKNKIYQVRSHAGNQLSLAQPLLSDLPTGSAVIYKETLSQVGHPMNGVAFSGVFGYFINEDFGNPINRIEDGIIGNIGPLKLKEKL